MKSTTVVLIVRKKIGFLADKEKMKDKENRVIIDVVDGRLVFLDECHEEYIAGYNKAKQGHEAFIKKLIDNFEMIEDTVNNNPETAFDAYTISVEKFNRLVKRCN